MVGHFGAPLNQLTWLSTLYNVFCTARTDYLPCACNPEPSPHIASRGGSITLSHPSSKEQLLPLKGPSS